MKKFVSKQRMALKPTAPQSQRPALSEQERTEQQTDSSPELSLKELMAELDRFGKSLEGRPLEDVLGGYGGRRSERRLDW